MINTANLKWYQPNEVNPPEAVKNWLSDDGSLTQKLKNTLPNFTLQILSQQERIAHDNELILFDTFIRPPSVREVLLLNHDTPMVFARSIIPYTNDTQTLFTKRSQPLGEVLFQTAGIKRGHLQISQTNGIWGRRNLFQMNSTKILVAEFFSSCFICIQHAVNTAHTLNPYTTRFKYYAR